MIAYTDGATSNNGSSYAIGGWAFIVLKDNGQTLIYTDSGSLQPATNNICELTAVINACTWLQENSTLSEKHIIYSDSAYIINCYKEKWYKKWQINGWRTSSKSPVLNQDLWEKLIPFFDNENFDFVKVKGHGNDRLNLLVDQMAVEARKKC